MISYAMHESYMMGETLLNMPALSVKSGLSYTYKFLTADFDNTFWVKDGHGMTFNPVQAKFDIGIEATQGNIKLRLSHTCWHPIASDGRVFDGIYGGCTKISLSYGY